MPHVRFALRMARVIRGTEALPLFATLRHGHGTQQATHPAVRIALLLLGFAYLSHYVACIYVAFFWTLPLRRGWHAVESAAASAASRSSSYAPRAPSSARTA